MAAPFLDPNASLDALRDDLVYLKCRLAKHELSRDLTKEVSALVSEWSEVHGQQLTHWDAQTAAQVEVNAADESLDAEVDAFDDDLRAVVGNDREDPRYRLYIPGGVYALKRPVLGEELETLRDWTSLLSEEDDERLKAHRDVLEKCVEAADKAVGQRQEADAKNAAFRATGGLAKYTQKALATRDRIWSELESRRAHAAPGALPRDWANRFFKPRTATVTEAERAARAEARERARQERDELAKKRKELNAKLRETQKELASLGKKPR